MSRIDASPTRAFDQNPRRPFFYGNIVAIVHTAGLKGQLVTRAIDMDGEASVLEGVVTPTSGQVFSGRLVSASQTGPHSLRLVFDVALAPIAQQPDNAIRVEPGLSVTEYSIQDSVVSVGIADSGRIGPWGMTYFVHVRSLKTVDGEELTELFGLQIEPPTDFEQLSCFRNHSTAVDSLPFSRTSANSTCGFTTSTAVL